MNNLATSTTLSGAFLLMWLAGCTVTIVPGGGPKSETLLDVTGRSIPDSGILSLQFLARSRLEVTIEVQANTDLADPDFEVVFGEVDTQDRDEIPLGDFEVIAADRRPGQEEASFTPDVYGTYTIFISDDNDVPGSRFSVTVTQKSDE